MTQPNLQIKNIGTDAVDVKVYVGTTLDSTIQLGADETQVFTVLDNRHIKVVQSTDPNPET